MMTSLNPFLDLDDAAAADHSVQSDEAVEAFVASTPQKNGIPLEVIAEELLKKQFVLTALEFYTEVQERGKDLSRLRNYFSNPSNFEQQINCKDSSVALFRTGSCSTFDSLDMTRYSDEGGQQVDEKVAVLEFELRKAKDTIKSLRANLTKTAEQESSCLHEDNLNGEDNLNNGMQVSSDEIKPLEMRAINHLVNEYLLNHGYKLSSITFADENEEQDFEDWDDVGINTAKPPELLKLYRDYNNHVAPTFVSHDVSTTTDDITCEIENTIENGNLALIEELNREIEALKQENEEMGTTIEVLKKEAQQESTNHDDIPPTTNESDECPVEPTPSCVGVDATQNDNKIDSHQAHHPDASRMSPLFWNALVSETQSAVEESWLKNEVVNVCQTSDELVGLLARCLPHIVPTVLLAKRDQLVPLILSAAALHGDLNVRNDLLNILFNLIKKPDNTQRQTILHGCVAYAKHVGFHRSEEELLPQCWEQIGHKYAERRQLVAEACGAIAPYLRSEMRGSLLVSILHQMQQEEKVDAARCSVVKSLALIDAFLDDDDKYKQGFEMLQSFLRDKSPTVRETTYLSLLPSFAVWSLHRGVLHSHLFDILLMDLETSISEQMEDAGSNSVAPVTYLLSYLLASVLLEIKADVSQEDPQLSESRFFEFKRDLENPMVVIGDEEKFARLVHYFDANVSTSKIDAESETLLWVTHEMVPRLLKLLKNLNPAFEETVSCVTEMFATFCSLFGRKYIQEKINPQFTNMLESTVDNLATAVVPVYAVTILGDHEDGRLGLNEFLFTTIVRLSQSRLSITGIKTCLTLLRSDVKHHDTIVQVLWSAVMHESTSVRASAAFLLVVMTTTHIEPRILSTRVLPALITLSTDQDIDVKIATIPSFCSVVINPSVTLESVERVTAQLIEIVSSAVDSSHEEQSQDGTLLGLHSLRHMLITTATAIGATVHPKFRDEFFLTHLVAIAASNNQLKDSAKRSIIALSLLEAYTCLSCCFIATNLLQGAFLPALKCLLVDMEALHPEHVNSVTSLISEAERKLDQGSVTSEDSVEIPGATHRPSFASGVRISGVHLGQAVSTGADDARKKILNTWGQLKSKAPTSPTVFPWKK